MPTEERQAIGRREKAPPFKAKLFSQWDLSVWIMIMMVKAQRHLGREQTL
jgi:hypothetical protein